MKRSSRLAASALAAAFLTGAMPATSAYAYDGDVFGDGEVTIRLHNMEDQSHPSSPPVDPGPVPNYTNPPLLPLFARMLLSDADNIGTFGAQFDIYERNQPVFDSFRVTNTGNLPLVFTLIDEDQTTTPAASDPNWGHLLVCFNALCDLGIYLPDSLFVKPAPLGAVLPGQSQVFTIGIKLAPNADWNEWDGVEINSVLHFQAVPGL